MTLNVVWLQPASGDADINVPAAQFRQVIQALAGGPTSQGVIAPVSAVVTQHGTGADFSVDVQAMQGIVAGDDIAEQGSYLITNTTPANFATPTAPGSGTRTHRLIAQVRDKRANSSWTTYDWTPVVLADTGSGEPAEPPSAMTLAHISIAAGQPNVSNANITQAYPLLRSLKSQGPQQSFQAGVGSWNVTNTWVAYSVGNWPTITFTVPPSGQVLVTIFAGVIGNSGNTAQIAFGISGTDTVAPTNGRCVSAGNAGSVAIRAANRSLVTGLTPGGTDTLTAYWQQNGSGCSDTNDGHMIVEPVL